MLGQSRTDYLLWFERQGTDLSHYLVDAKWRRIRLG
jgi:hypothetical protein